MGDCGEGDDAGDGDGHPTVIPARDGDDVLLRFWKLPVERYGEDDRRRRKEKGKKSPPMLYESRLIPVINRNAMTRMFATRSGFRTESRICG